MQLEKYCSRFAILFTGSFMSFGLTTSVAPKLRAKNQKSIHQYNSLEFNNLIQIFPDLYQWQRFVKPHRVLRPKYNVIIRNQLNIVLLVFRTIPLLQLSLQHPNQTQQPVNLFQPLLY